MHTNYYDVMSTMCYNSNRDIDISTLMIIQRRRCIISYNNRLQGHANATMCTYVIIIMTRSHADLPRNNNIILYLRIRANRLACINYAYHHAVQSQTEGESIPNGYRCTVCYATLKHHNIIILYLLLLLLLLRSRANEIVL